MSDRAYRLQLLIFWNELAGYTKVAEALEEALSAYRAGEMDAEEVDVLAEALRPTVRLERVKPTVDAEDGGLEALRFAVDDLRRMLREADADTKPMIASRLREQVAILRELEGGAS